MIGNISKNSTGFCFLFIYMLKFSGVIAVIDKILPGIFRIELPLPDLSLQTVNVYLLKGKKRNLLIDSGMNKPECKTALLEAFQKLDANLEDTDFFITHLHEDHFGLAPDLAADSSTIYLNAPETVFWASASRWHEGFEHGQKNGFPKDKLNKFIQKLPDFLKILPLDEMKDAAEAYKGQTPPRGRVQIVGDGKTLTVGSSYLQCIETPGHSSGHLCLYEPEKKLLFSGDHILETITPAIFLWPGEKRNPLREFLNSLNKVSGLEVDLVLPGHRDTFRNHRGRIAELKKHHHQREHEIETVLRLNGEKGRNAYEIASEVSWNVPQPWEQFDTGLKWMALAETLSHLKYMELQKKVISKFRDDEIEYYSLVAG